MTPHAIFAIQIFLNCSFTPWVKEAFFFFFTVTHVGLAEKHCRLNGDTSFEETQPQAM